MVFLAKHPMVDNYDLSSLRDLICAAAPLSEQLENEVRTRLNNDKLNFRQGNLYILGFDFSSFPLKESTCLTWMEVLSLKVWDWDLQLR